ncbi:MAG: hypothetical protein U9Q07_14775 [Planctomycetota bacterium]|nr:hypothetical protein [Planctomycetota bacterium]
MFFHSVTPAIYLEGDGTQGGGGSQTSDPTDGAEDQTGTPPSPDQGDKSGQTSSGTIESQLAAMKADYDHLLQTHSEMKTKWDKQKKAEDTAKQNALKEQGKFKDLYEEDHTHLETLKPKVERYEGVINRLLETELEGLSDEMKTLIPDGDPDKRLDWVVNAKKAGVFSQGTRAQGDNTPSPDGGEKPKTLEDLF